ncbi:GGDEF domain-containing protein [Candidatus Parcubacteria bacterium]|nr:GGDEF domain-containing protein [Candidatus Parcubacteria bacterium]
MSEDALKRKIAELEKTVESLEKDLIHDKLTGLKTRAFFEEEARIYFDVAMNAAMEHGPRRRQWFGFTHISFIFFDIDHFKKINDTLGHPAGDEVLQSIAESIKTSVRDGDTAARWGGEEIAVTLVGATERDAFHKAEDIRRQVENTRFGKFPDLKITISAGVASASPGGTFEKTLENADKALYAAKNTGRNRVVTYSEISK